MKTTFLVTDLGATQIVAPAPTGEGFFPIPLEKCGLVRKGLRVPGQMYIYIYIILATLRRGDMDSTCGYLTVSLQGNILDQLPYHTGHTCGGGVVKNMPRNLWEHFWWHIWNQPAVRL